jgi:hypothetical protein
MKIYNVRYDLNWGMRGVRKVHNFFFPTKPNRDKILKALANHYEKEINPNAVEILEVKLNDVALNLEEMDKQEDLTFYETKSTHGV